MTNWSFVKDEKRLRLDKIPGNRLRLTATRLAAVLGMNPFASPFRAWCEINRVWKEPFVDNKYTLAGKAIEPIIIDWCKEKFGEGVVSPQDFYGTTYKEVKYNFYKDIKVFGGMWDAKIIKPDRSTIAVIEIKTSSRPQDWVNEVPAEKLLQALMYGHLEGAKTTYVAVAFLTDDDYACPQNFQVREGENFSLIPFDTETTLVEFDGELCTISELMAYAEQWWHAYVESGISPEYDEEKDAKILEELHTKRPDVFGDSLQSMIARLNILEDRMNTIELETGYKEMEAECKDIKNAMKSVMLDMMDDDSDKVVAGNWTLSKSVRKTVDTFALKESGIYDEYLIDKVSYTLRKDKKE